MCLSPSELFPHLSKEKRLWWDSNPQPLNASVYLEVQCAIHCATEPGAQAPSAQLTSRQSGGVWGPPRAHPDRLCPGQVGALVSPRTSADGTCGERSEGHLNASLRGRHRPPPSASLCGGKSLCARFLYPILAEICSARFHSVAVITSALHAEGPGFEPQWNHEAGVALF